MDNKEEDVRKLIAAAAILAVVFVVGCQDTKKVTELQGQVDKMTQQITDMTGQVAKITAERDSFAKALADTTAKLHPVKAAKPTGGTKTGGTAPTNTQKPPRTGR
jgi:outer membrane murein-binding lipoprotein Lpp